MVKAKAIKDFMATIVAKFVMEQIIYRYGCPQFLLTDNATNFTLQVLPRLNKIMGIRGVFNTLYYPKSNGQVEKVNRTLEKILRKLVINNLSV